MADIRSRMLLAFLDWHLCQPQRVRDHCLDLAELKAMMRRLKTKTATDAVESKGS